MLQDFRRDEIQSQNCDLDCISGVTTSSLSIEAARKLLNDAGGIFIGPAEHTLLGIDVPNSNTIPQIPIIFSEKFLLSPHPLYPREQDIKIAQDVILAWDMKTDSWYCLGKTLVPESKGLPAMSQDPLLLRSNNTRIEIEGVAAIPLHDIEPAARIYEYAVGLLKLNSPLGKHDSILLDEWGRTGHAPERNHVCRTLLGNPRSEKRVDVDSEAYIVRYTAFESYRKDETVGLLYQWDSAI